MTDASASGNGNAMLERQRLENEAEQLQIDKAKQEIETKRSKVRRCVTYASVYSYLALAGAVVG